MGRAQGKSYFCLELYPTNTTFEELQVTEDIVFYFNMFKNASFYMNFEIISLFVCWLAGKKFMEDESS